ncbi:netrin receptor UNC5C-like isoform X2 [Gordionus sp. m RMFG-2023]|uniref:netrin receptor UNC5C-like isoform X2 n=1 Tax=Gordionus sp. m RMFG-2023 TaxID=3053472 RepID=UPI0031FC290F
MMDSKYISKFIIFSWIFIIIDSSSTYDSAIKLPNFVTQPQDTFVVKHKPALLTCSSEHSSDLLFVCNGESMKGQQHLIRQSRDPITGNAILETGLEIGRGSVEEYYGSEGYRCHCLAFGFNNNRRHESIHRINEADNLLGDVDIKTRDNRDSSKRNGEYVLEDSNREDSTLERGEAISRQALVRVASIKKYFEKQPVSISVEMNSTVELQCMPPYGVPKPIVYWTKDGVALDVERDPNLILSSEGSLLISMASLRDRGNYSCVAKNLANQRSTEPASLNVYVNGGWSQWSEWPSCSDSCSKGYRKRFRTCTDPAPVNNGKHCGGYSTQRENCQEYCPINGGWSEWNLWSVCSEECLMYRRRACTNPSPMNGGKNCFGTETQVSNCSEDLCINNPNSLDFMRYTKLNQNYIGVDDTYNTRGVDNSQSSQRTVSKNIALYSIIASVLGIVIICALIFLAVYLKKRQAKQNNRRYNYDYGTSDTFSPYLNGASNLLLGLEGDLKKFSNYIPKDKHSKFAEYDANTEQSSNTAIKTPLSKFAREGQNVSTAILLRDSDSAYKSNQSDKSSLGISNGTTDKFAREQIFKLEKFLLARQATVFKNILTTETDDLKWLQQHGEKNNNEAYYSQKDKVDNNNINIYSEPAEVIKVDIKDSLQNCEKQQQNFLKGCKESENDNDSGNVSHSSEFYNPKRSPRMGTHLDKHCNNHFCQTNPSHPNFLDSDQNVDNIPCNMATKAIVIDDGNEVRFRNAQTCCRATLAKEHGYLNADITIEKDDRGENSKYDNSKCKGCCNGCESENHEEDLAYASTNISPNHVNTYEHDNQMAQIAEYNSPHKIPDVCDVNNICITSVGSYGGMLNLKNTDISLFIPPGAINQSSDQTIILSTCKSEHDPELQSNQTLLSPVIYMGGPSEIALTKPAVLKIPYKSLPPSDTTIWDYKIMMGELIHRLDEDPTGNKHIKHILKWKNVLNIGQETIQSPVYCHFDQTEHNLHLLTEQLATFALVGQFKISNDLANQNSLSRTCPIHSNGHLSEHNIDKEYNSAQINLQHNLTDIYKSHQPSAMIVHQCANQNLNNTVYIPVDNQIFRIPQSLKSKLCQLIDKPRQDGRDWRFLAKILHFDRYIHYFATKQSPTDTILTLWESVDNNYDNNILQNSNPSQYSLVKLRAIFTEMNRVELVEIIQNYVLSTAKNGKMWV